MGGEILPGKRTLIQQEGEEPFELPQGHRVSLNAHLLAPTGGATFKVHLEEQDDVVVVHVHHQESTDAAVDPATRLVEYGGYPFPE